jgi:Na+-transporting methylmalonyl-CoA/oxaloacetate decarboxylase gamma subunit
MALLSAMSFVAINIWTGAPLLALWVGSRVVGRQRLTMGSVFLVLILLVAFVTAMAVSLTRLSARYDELAGRPEGEPRISPWLRSLREEEDDLIRSKTGTTAAEWIVTASTVIAVIALEIWFFFFAGSPLPS